MSVRSSKLLSASKAFLGGLVLAGGIGGWDVGEVRSEDFPPARLSTVDSHPMPADDARQTLDALREALRFSAEKGPSSPDNTPFTPPIPVAPVVKAEDDVIWIADEEKQEPASGLIDRVQPPAVAAEKRPAPHPLHARLDAHEPHQADPLPTVTQHSVAGQVVKVSATTMAPAPMKPIVVEVPAPRESNPLRGDEGEGFGRFNPLRP